MDKQFLRTCNNRCYYLSVLGVKKITSVKGYAVGAIEQQIIKSVHINSVGRSICIHVGVYIIRTLCHVRITHILTCICTWQIIWYAHIYIYICIYIWILHDDKIFRNMSCLKQREVFNNIARWVIPYNIARRTISLGRSSGGRNVHMWGICE